MPKIILQYQKSTFNTYSKLTLIMNLIIRPHLKLKAWTNFIKLFSELQSWPVHAMQSDTHKHIHIHWNNLCNILLYRFYIKTSQSIFSAEVRGNSHVLLINKMLVFYDYWMEEINLCIQRSRLLVGFLAQVDNPTPKS